jgi:hypothetical protein
MIALPRMLIIVRAGRNSIHKSWIWTLMGLADVALSVYDESDFTADGAKYVHSVAGGKFPGIMALFEAHPEIIDSYDYFWLMDDDLTLPFESLRTILKIVAHIPFPLLAPGLTYYSYFTWPIAVANTRFLFRATNFVEVMMPIMSRDFLRAAMVAFNDSYSGWGQEWLWRKMLIERQSFAAVIDSAPVAHVRPFGSGSMGKNRTADSREPLDEMNDLLARYGLERYVPFQNIFGVTAGISPRLLVGDALLQEALLGYPEMMEFHYDNFVRCNDTLIREARPVATEAQLRETDIFNLVANKLREGWGGAL